MIWFIVFIFGLLIGSFLNVISLRYEEGKAILGKHITTGRSHCTSCQVTLKWYELVPLFSFLFQGAKCRHCKHSLSWQYPIVEFLTAGLSVAILWQLQNFYGSWQTTHPELIGWLYAVMGTWLLVTYTAITLSVIDFRLSIIPDQSNILLGFCGLILLAFRRITEGQLGHAYFSGAYSSVFGGTNNAFLSALIAVIFVLALFGGIIYFSKGRGMGLGDLKLAVPLALLLGWPDILIAVMSAFIIGAVIGLLLIFNKKKTMKGTVPFGPFLIIGLYIAIFYSESLLQWYFNLL